MEVGNGAGAGRPSSDLPHVVGIVNITEDSFSDGGLYLSSSTAVAHAVELHAEGAAIVELGPAASHPGSAVVTADQEQARLKPVLTELVARGIAVGVDSFLPETQLFALANGASYLNDIKGFPDIAIYPDLARSACLLVVMHSVQRGPATEVQTNPRTILGEISEFLGARLDALLSAGISRERLIVDPGLGFFLGSNLESSLAVITAIGRIKAEFDLPVLLSPSRKSFLRAIVGRDVEHVGPATLAAELYAACNGADYLRTHDVAALQDGLKVLRAAREYRPDWTMSEP